jgi:NAD(P)-dependent dehydrogenase (short-subunit alcohol dehydrogenase family)
VPGELRFTEDHVSRFAAASGDRNPLHIDPDFGRETAFGACVVHGALLAIAMAGALAPADLQRVRALKLRFSGAVLPGTPAHLEARASERRPGAWELRLSVRGKLAASGLLAADPRAFARILAEPETVQPDTARREMRLEAAEVDFQDPDGPGAIAGRYAAGPQLRELAGELGADALDVSLLEGLAWASYVVGMEMPGRDGLFSALTLGRVGDDAVGPAARYGVTVRAYDPRGHQLLLDGVLGDDGGMPCCVAAIDAFAIPPPPAPDLGALGPAGVRTAKCPGPVAVIGASRGFGASLSLALVARGYEVEGIYSSSGAGVAALQAAPARAGSLRLHRLDASDPDAMAQFAVLVSERGPALRGLVLNAALVPLAMGLTGTSALELAGYVADSVKLAAVPLGALLGQLDAQHGWVVLCSSAALAAPPRDWPHYVAAKAALEGLAGWVAATMPGLRVLVIRPAAMRTALANTPSGRLAAMAPETVAGHVADRLAADTLAAGLTMLEAAELGAGR